MKNLKQESNLLFLLNFLKMKYLAMVLSPLKAYKYSAINVRKTRVVKMNSMYIYAIFDFFCL